MEKTKKENAVERFEEKGTVRMREATTEINIDKKEGEELQWYFRPWVVAAAIFVFGPLGLILLWFRPRTKLYLKISISAIVLILTAWMMVETAKYYEKLMLHYEELAEVIKSMQK